MAEIQNWVWNERLPQYGEWYSQSASYSGLNIESITELNVFETDDEIQFKRFLTLDNEQDLHPAANQEGRLITYAFVIIGDAIPGFSSTELYFGKKTTRNQAPSWSSTTQVVLIAQTLHNKTKWRLIIYSGSR